MKLYQVLAPLGRWRGLRHRQQFLAAVSPSLWCLDHADVSAERLEILGWALSTNDVDWTLTVNGRRVTSLSKDIARPDIAAVFPFVERAGFAGFSASARLTPSELSGRLPIEIQCTDQGLHPLREQHAFFVPPLASEPWAMPSAAQMRRVHGATDEMSFRTVGFSNLCKLDAILKRVAGRGVAEVDSLLDWGCGSGRLLRHLGAASARITGVDVDHDNVTWCAAHLPFATFQTIPLHPPTQLRAGDFDLVIGISVFTHLSDAVQREWLQELRRVTRPGAILMMSIHGPAATALGGDLVLWQHVQKHGLADGSSRDLDGLVAERGYYRNSYHSHRYVRDVWGDYFDVVEIVPACIGNIQDLVVLRAR